MTTTDLLSALQQLSRSEKLYIMQFLISELAQEESEWIQPGLAYPVWSPYDAYDAADAMLRVLEEAKTNGPT